MAVLSEGSNSLITNANLISKVYFPRLIVPASAVIVSFVDFLISFGLLALLMVYYGVWPHWHLLALPIFTLLALIASTGAGLWLAALNVEYRDFRYVVPFIVQFGLYVSPVGFSSSIVPERWRLIYSLNPMVGVIDGFRWAISGGRSAIFLPDLITSWDPLLKKTDAAGSTSPAAGVQTFGPYMQDTPTNSLNGKKLRRPRTRVIVW